MKQTRWNILIGILLFTILLCCSCSTPEQKPKQESEQESEQETTQHIHEWQDWETVQHPNCTNEGTEERRCLSCSATETQSIPVKHDLIEHPGSQTCTGLSWLPYVTCSKCEYSTYQEVSPTHNAANRDPDCAECIRELGHLNLEFTLDETGEGYLVTGRGTCSDKDVVIPKIYNSKPVIGIQRTAFWHSQTITSIVIPDSVTSISFGSFAGCNNLESITIPFIGSNESGTQTITLESITGGIEIPSLKTVVITGGTSIGENEFQFCNYITSVTIPDSVTSIGSYAFYSCPKLENVILSQNSKLTTIGDGAFDSCTKLTNFTIPNGVTTIGIYAFQYCQSLKNITIPNSVTSIGGSAFCDCDSFTSITIPNSVKKLGWYAFRSCSNLSKVTLESGLQDIGHYTFQGCTSLTSITVPDGITDLSNVFSGCTNLKNVVLPDSVTDLSSTFSNCTSLESITVPNGVTNLHSTFSGCTSLTSVNIPHGVTELYHTFNGCTALASITIPNTVTSLSDGAFQGCTSLKSITIPNSVTSLFGTFKNCTGLTSITLPNSVTDLGAFAFENCTNLKSITIPNSVTEIGNNAFKGCTSLVYRSYDKAYYLGNDANPYLVLVEAKSNTITSCNIHNDTKIICFSAFENCAKLTSITIPNNVIRIGRYAFYNCKSLQSIVIAKSVAFIDFSAFCCYTDSSLSAVYYCGTSKEWNQIVWDTENDLLTSTTRYYYSADKPTTSGKYWHYDEQGNPVAW